MTRSRLWQAAAAAAGTAVVVASVAATVATSQGVAAPESVPYRRSGCDDINDAFAAGDREAAVAALDASDVSVVVPGDVAALGVSGYFCTASSTGTSSVTGLVFEYGSGDTPAAASVSWASGHRVDAAEQRAWLAAGYRELGVNVDRFADGPADATTVVAYLDGHAPHTDTGGVDIDAGTIVEQLLMSGGRS